MRLLFFRLKSFLSYWLEAVEEHSLHSPFFFDFYTRQVKPRPQSGAFKTIERLRAKLLRDSRVVVIDDFGSKTQQNSRRKISDIARTSLSSRRFSAMYNRMIVSAGARSIAELGTSLGINTLYLSDDEATEVTTFEGAPAIAKLAALTFESAGRKNVRLVVGNIDETLPAFIQGTRQLDFVFMDANHRCEPTLRYFNCLLEKIHEKTVVVVDDIHYSPEMEKAWKTIKNHRLVYGTADLFRCGILFFDPSLNKQHVILQV